MNPKTKATVIMSASLGLAMLTPALARNNGEWGSADPTVSAWFRALTQPDNPVMSCCGEADAFQADEYEVIGDHYVAVITDGKGIIPNGTKIPVPNGKMKWDAGNPTGHGIIFLGVPNEDGSPRIYCYVTPGGA